MQPLFDSFSAFSRTVEAGKRIACFGSRETPDYVLEMMFRIGSYITENGAICSSGHAYGADHAFELGACASDPTHMVVNLPWPSYNSDLPIAEGAEVNVLSSRDDEGELIALASQFHDSWDKVQGRRGLERLHARNILIAQNAALGICYLNHSRVGYGGSGQCYRYLRSKGVPVIDLADESTFATWVSLL